MVPKNKFSFLLLNYMQNIKDRFTMKVVFPSFIADIKRKVTAVAAAASTPDS